MGLRLNKIGQFYGGITTNDRDTTTGVAVSVEELDVFTNAGFIQPETALGSESFTTEPSDTMKRFHAYTVDDSGNLYALADNDAATPKARIYKISDAGQDNPGTWDIYLTSAQNARSNSFISNIAWHGVGTPITTGYLYYVTGTNDLYRYGDIKTSPSEASVGTLSGLSSTADTGHRYVPMLRANGELFIGHGSYIANVDSAGVFIEKAFTLPNEWEVVGLAEYGTEMAILAKNVRDRVATGSRYNQTRVFFWDRIETSGYNNEATIHMGGPQGIVNFNESLYIFCAKDGMMRIFSMRGLVPEKVWEIECQSEYNIDEDKYIIGPNSIFVKDNSVYFGLCRGTDSDKSGLYAMGRVRDDQRLGVILSRRFSSYTGLHYPLSAYSMGPNMFCSFYEQTDEVPTYQWNTKRIEGNNSPTRSSNAIYESVYINGGTDETMKDWPGFILTARAMPTNCSIKFDARTDHADSYNSTIDADSMFTLSSSNDQQAQTSTSDRYWYRDIKSLRGRLLQIKLTFTSSGTNCPQLTTLGIFSREEKII